MAPPTETKARYAFVYGDFRRVHRMGLIACRYRALVAAQGGDSVHELLQTPQRGGLIRVDRLLQAVIATPSSANLVR